MIRPWKPRPPGMELDRCKRYCELLLPPNNNNNAVLFGAFAERITTVIDAPFFFQVQKRTTPTLVSNVSAYNAGSPSGTQVAAFNGNAGGYFALTGSLTVTTIGNETPSSMGVRLSASTSWSGANGDSGYLYFGPGVIIYAEAGL